MSWSLSKYFPSRFIPTWLLTWLPGPYARMQVDQAQTSFFTGRQFRTTMRLTLTAATPVDVRIVYRE